MLLIGFLLTVILVFIDQISKSVIFNAIGLNHAVTVIPGVFQLNGCYNTGAAFSMLNDHSWVLLLISIIATLCITYLMKDFSTRRRPLYSIALLLIYSGTIGNLIDRMFNGYKVYDFIEVTFMDFAIFNIADSYLTIGMIMMIVFLLFFEPKDPISLKWRQTEKEVQENE